MTYPKVNIPKGHEIVLQQLKEQIESGKLAPGQRLPSVVELAAQFGVGRSTLREALSALKAMGWLSIQHGGGTFVSQTLPDSGEKFDLFEKAQSVQELLQVRKIMETGTTALAAKQRNADDLAIMASILTRMEEHVGDEEISEQADVEFHLMIARAAHNSLATGLMESLSSRIQATMKDTRLLWFFSEHASARQLMMEHRLIYQAILEQNETLAAERMKQHLEKVEQTVHKQLE